MTNALVTFDQLQQMAGALARSGIFGIKTTDAALALMLVAQAEGAHPASIAQDYDLIQGRAARKSHSVLARFQAAGGRVDWHELSESKAEATFTHPQGSARISWTFEQAKKAGLTGKDNWKNYPRAMLRARCIAEGVRAAYPAAIGGLMTSEEASDVYTAPRQVHHMGAADVVQHAAPSELVERAERAADEGTQSLQAFWSSISKDERKGLVGMLDGLKERAAKVLPMPKPDADTDDFASEYSSAEGANK